MADNLTPSEQADLMRHMGKLRAVVEGLHHCELWDDDHLLEHLPYVMFRRPHEEKVERLEEAIRTLQESA